MKIAILDYGVGNIRSIKNALKQLEQEYFVSDDPEKLAQSDRLIFPGVGSAGFAMKQLKKKGLDQFLKKYSKPVLGICLGMQLLFEFSEEDHVDCLGIIPGKIQKFTPSKKIPHMGWNEINFQFLNRGSFLLKNIPANSFLYFVHSYFLPVSEFTMVSCEYQDEKFSAMVQKDNFWGMQFHPEKSGKIGQKLLFNFLKNE